MVFLRFKEERRDASYSPRIQKRQAVQFLEVYRPQLAIVWALRIEGKSYTQISLQLKVHIKTVRDRSKLALRWLTMALLDESIELYNAH